MKKILILDNYDSFTYNLYHLINESGEYEVKVIRNDKIALPDVEQFDKIVLSPGPGIPEEAGMLLEVIRQYAPHKSILGVCLGHQAIGEVLGAKLFNLKDVYHGVQTPVTIIADDYLFAGLNKEFLVGRYHSWVIAPENLPSSLIVTAVSKEGQIMGIKHKEYDVHGIQFHPESILTPQGKTIIQNFLNN